MLRRIFIAAFAVLTATLLLAQNTQRLIMKDGSYQEVSKYEIQGDRVHYFSAERAEWEDVPKEIVDWAATKKYADDLKDAAAKSAQEVDKEVQTEQEERDAMTPQVAPNLRLPLAGGVIALDKYQGTPELVELNQGSSEVNVDRKGNILRAAINPLASAKQKIEMPGAHAKAQMHEARPSIFLNVDVNGPETNPDGSATQPKDRQLTKSDDVLIPPPPDQRFRIVKVNQKKDSRVIGNLKVAITGKVSQQESFIPTEFKVLSGGWVEITPKQDLAPGEYAVAEMLSEKEMNLYVWDFGYNPNAPENATAWKPEKAQPQKPAEPPKLTERGKDDN